MTTSLVCHTHAIAPSRVIRGEQHGNVAYLPLLTSVNDRHYWGEALQPKPFELV